MTLADEDNNSTPTDDVNRAITGNVAIQVAPPASATASDPPIYSHRSSFIQYVILTFECLFALLPVFRLAGWFNYFGKQSCFFGDMQIHQIDPSEFNKKQNKTPNAIWSMRNDF